MTPNKLLILSLFVFLGLTGVSVWAYYVLPADIQIAIHWGVDGKPDRFSDKFSGLFIIPIVGFALSLFYRVLPNIEPRKTHILRSEKFYAATWLGLISVLSVAHGAILFTAFGYAIPVLKLVMISAGLLLMVIGNYMGKSQSNFFLGVRTPWTLSSELSWAKTNRLAGKLLMIFGISVGAFPFANLPDEALFTFVIIGAVAIAVVSTLYSFIIWKMEAGREKGLPVANHDTESHF